MDGIPDTGAIVLNFTAPNPEDSISIGDVEVMACNAIGKYNFTDILFFLRVSKIYGNLKI